MNEEIGRIVAQNCQAWQSHLIGHPVRFVDGDGFDVSGSHPFGKVCEDAPRREVVLHSIEELAALKGVKLAD